MANFQCNNCGTAYDHYDVVTESGKTVCLCIHGNAVKIACGVGLVLNGDGDLEASCCPTPDIGVIGDEDQAFKDGLVPCTADCPHEAVGVEHVCIPGATERKCCN